MPNPFYTFTQNSFPGRVARSQEINSQFALIEAGFEALGDFPAGDATQLQFNNGGVFGASASLTWNGSTLTAANVTTPGTVTAAALAVSGAVSFSSVAVSGAVTVGSTLGVTGAATVGGTLGVTGKLTAAATEAGDSSQTVVTKGYAASTFAPVSHTHDAAAIVSGTFADARIAASNITQHVGAIDHDSLLNYSVAQHREINDSIISTTSLWSSDKINDVVADIIAGSVPPPGFDTQVTFNDNGVFGADAGFTFDKATESLTLGGKVITAATSGGDAATVVTTKGYVDSVVSGLADAVHTHLASQITSGTFDPDRIPSLDASKIGSGSLLATRGGTGQSSYVVGNYLRSDTSNTLAQRTPAQVLADIGAAASSHTHDASAITTGSFSTSVLPTIPVTKGGSGLTSVTSGYYLRGNGTSAMSARSPSQVLSDIGAAASSHTHSATAITTGTLPASRGGTGISSFTAGNYIRAASSTSLEQRTPAQVAGDLGVSLEGHEHSAAAITSGTLSSDRLPTVPVSRGGTGQTSSFAGAYLVGTGVNSYELRTGVFVRDDIGAAPVSHTHSAADITSGTLAVARGGTGLSTITAGSYMVGNGTSAVSLKSAATVKSDLNIIESHVAGGGQITVSTSAPSGGANGDIWLKV